MRGLSAFYQLHAAVAVYRGSALILSGPSEAGKTSLLVGLTAAGALAYTDEIALFAAEDLRVHPFPRDLIIHRGTQQLFPETVADLPPWKIHSEYCFFPASLFGGCSTAAPVPCCGLVFPEHRPGVQMQVFQLGQAEAAGRLLGESFSLWDWGEASIELVGRLVEACPARKLVFSDAREAAGLLLGSEI